MLKCLFIAEIQYCIEHVLYTMPVWTAHGAENDDVVIQIFEMMYYKISLSLTVSDTSTNNEDT